MKTLILCLVSMSALADTLDNQTYAYQQQLNRIQQQQPVYSPPVNHNFILPPTLEQYHPIDTTKYIQQPVYQPQPHNYYEQN